MENAVLVGLSRQVALRRELDVIANNIANLNTSGFKSDAPLFQEFMMPLARSDGFAGQGGRISFVVDRATWTDMRAGAVQQTGNPLDVAVDGDAFFAVQTARGERYTRNGAFQINAAGELVTAEGARVLGEAGPIVFQARDRAISIAPDGTVSADGEARGKLRLVQFAQPGRLQKDMTSSFAAPAGVQPQPATQARVTQGALERSNVQAVVEMTRMIEAARSYASVAQMAEQQGNLRRTAIERLAETPA